MVQESGHFYEPGRVRVETCILNKLNVVHSGACYKNRALKTSTHHLLVWGAWHCVPHLPHFSQYLLNLVINQL